ncbi:MAG: cation transporter [Clostridia bacterium]|nr:cation transporter [Clostridia bacterium]
MEKKYAVKNMCCANCAAIAERKAKKVKGVKELELNFMMQRLTVVYEEGADVAAVEAEVIKAIRKIEPEAEIA